MNESETTTPAEASEPQQPRSLIPFLVGQLILVGVAAGGVIHAVSQIEAQAELPPLRENPLDLGPVYDFDWVITDEQLRTALLRLRPRLYGPDTSVGHTDHNLRFWGYQSKFDDRQYVSGEEMRQFLTDHQKFTEVYADPDKPPLIIEVPGGGFRYRDFEGSASSSHDDHTMACLAEIGTPLAYPVNGPTRSGPFREVVEQSLRDFSLNQLEYEWSTLTYALFVRSRAWVTSEGQEVDFDLLVDRIMRQDMPQGVCMGNHRLHSLVMILRADDEWEDEAEPLLSPTKRDEVVRYLQANTALLVQHQHSSGFWNVDWPSAKPASHTPTGEEGDRLSDRIIATGHALEWWALVPESEKERIHPPRKTIIDASQWLVTTIDGLSDDEVRRYNSFLSHSGRALALWRGKYAWQVHLKTQGDDKPVEAENMP